MDQFSTITYQMQSQPTHYQLPDDTDASIRRMIFWLCASFAGLVIVVSLVFYHAQTIARHIPFSAELRFVRPYEKMISRYFSSMAGDPEISAYLQHLTGSLRDVMELSDDIVIRVHYVDSNEINAFATLGGHMVVFRGLLEELPDENSLAMVLAHEISHIAHRDPVASVGRGLALQLIVGFVTGGGASAENIIDLMGGSGMALFSREQESQADIAALHALHAHYGHVNGYRSFFKGILGADRMDADDENGSSSMAYIPDWLASHPATEERLQILDNEREEIASELGTNLPLPAIVRNLSTTSTDWSTD